MPDLSKAKLPVAVDKRTHLSLDYHHVTTTDFMFMRPVFYRHVLPGEHGKIDMMAQMRLSPVAVPTYGRAQMNVRTFFVPYRTIMPNWDSFIDDTIGFASSSEAIGLVTGLPRISNQVIWDFFESSVFVTPDGNVPVSETVSSNSEYDFVAPDNTLRKFTWLGKACFAVLRGLGYDFCTAKSPTIYFNALGLLAYAKVWLDWYSQSAYLDSSAFQQLDRLTKLSRLDSYDFTTSDLAAIFRASWCVNYDGDYFTAAYDSPSAPNPSNFTGVVLPDLGRISQQDVPGNSSAQVTNDELQNGSPVAVVTDNMLTQYQVDALKALNDYMRRNAISGARNCDRYLARYGVQLPSDKLNRCLYLGNMLIDVNFGDVMSHADTSDSVSNLGDYAGRGDGVGNKSVSYDSEGEFGMVISVASVIPNGGYVQGYDRNNRHLDKMSFFVPENDSIGVMAIEKGELFTSKRSLSFAATQTEYQKTFGFLPTFAEYKTGRSFVTGDYACVGSFAGANAWHLNRLFSEDSFDGSSNNIVHSLSFSRGEDRQQYNRIFQYTGNDNEHFNCVFHFNVDAIAPCHSLFDAYDFKDNGKSVELQANGVKLN